MFDKLLKPRQSFRITSPSKLFALALFCQKPVSRKQTHNLAWFSFTPIPGIEGAQKLTPHHPPSQSFFKEETLFSSLQVVLQLSVLHLPRYCIDLKGKALSTELQTAFYWLQTWNKGLGRTANVFLHTCWSCTYQICHVIAQSNFTTLNGRI